MFNNVPKVTMVKKELKSLMYIEQLDTITQAFNPTKRFFKMEKIHGTYTVRLRNIPNDDTIHLH